MCVCVRARARARVCVCACVRVFWSGPGETGPHGDRGLNLDPDSWFHPRAHGLDVAGPDVDPGIGGFRVGWVGTHGARLGIPCKITARGKRLARSRHGVSAQRAGQPKISVQIGFHMYSALVTT